MNVAAVDVLTPDDVWGAHAVEDGEPPCAVYENVLFDPKLWGLFDSNGDIILTSAFRRGAEGGLVRSKAVASLARADLPVLDQDVVYMGGLLDHFGHFICTSLSRMWAWSRFSDRPFLFHGWEFQDIRQMQIARLCFDHFGVDPTRILQPTTPCIVRRVIIPGSAFDEQRLAYTAFRDACLQVGSAFTGDPGGLLYLSKTQLPAGVSRISNEMALEQELASHGVEVVYPESLSIEAQIALFSSGRTILGGMSSAFHVQIFAPQGGKRICLQPLGTLNSNYVLLDKLAGATTLYVKPLAPSVVASGTGSGFITQCELADPQGVARHLLELA